MSSLETFRSPGEPSIEFGIERRLPARRQVRGAPPAESEATSTADRERRPCRRSSARARGGAIGPSGGSALTAEHEFDCDGKVECANVWTITTTKRGRYEIVGEVRDNDGNRREVRDEIDVR